MRIVALLILLAAVLGGGAVRAEACEAGRDAELTITECSRVIKLHQKRVASDTEGVLAYYHRGNAERDLGRTDAALADYDRAIELAPRFAAAYNNRGLLLFRKGDADRALPDFDRAIELDPELAEAYNNRAVLFLNRRDFDRAHADFGKAIGLRPDFADAFFGRAVAYARASEYDLAIADYSRAIELRPDHAEAYNNRGDAYMRKGDHDRAIADLDRAIELDPRFVAAYYTRGEIHKGRGDLDRALADLRLAMDLDTKNAFRSFGEALVADIETQLAAAAAGSSDAAAEPERRVALVIGNGAYRSVQALDNPVRDAEAIAAALRQSGVNDVTVASNVDRDGLVEALQAFASKADTADWAVIYYAGHGLELSGTNYLIPVDARLASDRDVPDEAISLDRVMTAVEGARKLRLVVVDACRNNPFLAQMKVTSATRSVGRGLALVEPSQATLVAFAAKAGSVALDGDSDNSPFAASFARRIVEPGIEINKVFRLVRNDVLVATGNQQEPFVYGSLPPEDFFFVPPAK